MKQETDRTGEDRSGSASRRALSFRPRARLVSILGEHLISDQAVGLVELVKNSYDADATEVHIEILGLASVETTTVIIRDNGFGMTVQDIEEKWLSPAVDHKEKAKRRSERTELGRLPIGEKGVGRFAVHQIGRSLELITRAAVHREIVVRINWDDFESGESFLDTLNVSVQEQDPEIFTGESTGTLMRIQRARCQWTRPLLEKLHRTFRRLQSPLRQDQKAQFKVILICPDFPEFENIDSTDILKRAHYEFRALIDANGECDFEYRCNHPALTSRSKSDTANLIPLAKEEVRANPPGCGPFWLNLYVWDRTRDYLAQSGVSAKELSAQCGVSLFRDDLRVLPYGDPGDDWLLLDQERIQDPSGRIGNNQVVGIIQVFQENNLQLRDTTNREGLIENEAFRDLRALSRAAIKVFTTYWRKDRPPSRPTTTEQHGSLSAAREVASALKESARDDVNVELPTSSEGPPNGETSPKQIATVTQRKAVEMLIDNLDGVAASDREKDNRIERLLALAATGLAAERVVHEFGRQVGAANEALGHVHRFAPGGSRSAQALNVLESCLSTLRSEFRILAPYEVADRAGKDEPVAVRETIELALLINKRLIEAADIQTSVVGADFCCPANGVASMSSAHSRTLSRRRSISGSAGN